MNRKHRLLSFFVLAFLAAPANPCIGGHLASVHFNSHQPDFGTVPRRGLIWEQDDRPMGSTRMYGMGDYSIQHTELRRTEGSPALAREERRELILTVLQKERPVLASGDWKRLRAFWQAFVQNHGTTGPVQDRLEVLSHSSLPSASVLRYLGALDSLEGPSTGWNGALAAFEALASDTSLPTWLREHAAYQRASGFAQWLNYKRAVLLWQAQLRAFPDGEKREAALVMIARACLLHKALPDGVATGRAAAEQLLRSFPQTRFRVAARGLLARADLEEGQFERAAETYCALSDGDSIVRVRARAKQPEREQRLVTLQLIAYLRAFNNATDYYGYRFSAKGIARSLELLKPDTGKRFLEHLIKDPSVSVPYFYYRLYHCDNSSADLARLAALADRIGQKQVLPAPVRVRLAEIYYQNRAYGKAVSWASTAVQDPDEKVRARALYVRAGCRYRRRQFDPARQDLERLLRECPRSNVRHGAHELSALCAEGQGDFSTALDHYFAIDYREDYAYLIDVRMPVATLENYWRTRSHHKHLLAYSIALRHLRLEHWDDTRRWLDRVPEPTYQKFVGPIMHYSNWSEDFRQDGAMPRKVLVNLSGLYAAAERARGSEAKAAARYAYARAYYTQGLLQLYNAPLWQGNRMMDFSWYWNTAVATPSDDKAVQRYMYQHEVYAHTRRICLDIAREYPNTKTAPKALYRAACAADRLYINSWWDQEGNPVLDHDKEASKLMARLAKRYPKDPLAKPARKYAGVFAGSGDAAE